MSHPLGTFDGMRFLHTSDWHLGRQFHQTSLLDEQAEAIDRMVQIAADESVDAVLIAGDLFDRAIPSTGAVELLDEALVRLRDTGALVVAITGNHDSPTRVGFADRILTRAGVTVRSDPARLAEPVLVADHVSGSGGVGVAVYPIPYLDPSAVRAAGPEGGSGDDRTDPDATDPDATDPDATSAGPTGASAVEPARSRRITHESVLRDALRLIDADRRTRDLPSVVVAHAFVANMAPRPGENPVEECDSERVLAVGGTDRVDQGIFSDLDYVALGHLHGRQSWADGRIAYSGSPLAYSFSEQRHAKGVRIVELSHAGVVSGRHIDLGVGRGLCTITGTLDELLRLPEHAAAEPMRVRAVLSDVHLPSAAMARLRQRFPHAAEIVHEPPCRDGDASRNTSSHVRQRGPFDLTMEFLAEQWGDDVDDEAATLLRRGVSAIVGSVP